MGSVELNKFLTENLISTADCRDVSSRRQKAKDMFRPPNRPAPPPASTSDRSQVRWRKDDTGILVGLERAEMNGKKVTVVSVDHALGKVQIRVEGMDKMFKVKSEHLQIFIEEEDEELE